MAHATGIEDLGLPDARVHYLPRFLAAADADRLLEALTHGIRWRQESITMFGRRIPQPRLIAWHGEPDCVYTYSGLRLEPEPWSAELAELRGLVTEATGVDHDCVLLNLYRDGGDSMGMHADDEAELGPEPHVASVSLGAERAFHLVHRHRRDVPRVQLVLEHGSLLVMSGPTQAAWKHGLPKTARPVAPRINLTFRRIGRALRRPAPAVQ